MNVTARLMFLVDLEEDAIAVEGAAYAAGGWVNVQRRPAMQGSNLPAVLIVTWDHRTTEDALAGLRWHLPKQIQPI